MKPIFLIGFMGSGKTTLGQALSHATGLTFVDLDHEIERRTSLSVAQIFDRHGEDRFREIERQTLASLADNSDIIIACGGGTPCHFGNVDLMNAAGTTILLEASVDRLHKRLLLGRTDRPLIASMTDSQLRSYIEEALRARAPHYAKARHRFDANRLDTADMIDESVELFIKQFHLTPSNSMP